MSITCPLSGSQNVTPLATINTSDLVKLYRRKFGVNVAAEYGATRQLGLYHCLDSDLRFFYPMLTGSDTFYETLQKFDWYYLDEKYEYTFARDFIKNTDSVLEIGCGKGAFAQKISASQYLGLEFNQKAIDTAAAAGVTVLRQSIQAHAETHSNQYDVVCAFQVLEHVAEINEFISASLACLKEGGLLIYSIPSADSFISLVTNYILNMPPHHMSWWSDQALTHVARLFNLKVMAIQHEKLAARHRRWYASTMALASFRNWLHLNHAVLDCSLGYQVLNAAALAAGVVLSPGLVDPRLLPNGASVTVVYQKQAG